MGELEPTVLLYRQESKFTHDPGWPSESSGYLAKRAQVQTKSQKTLVTLNVQFTHGRASPTLLTAQRASFVTGELLPLTARVAPK